MNCQPADQVYEFENLEELRLFDPKYRESFVQCRHAAGRTFSM